MEYYKDRCFGCHHYGGIAGGSFENSIAICEIGHKGVRASSGCSDFQADHAARCSKCYYHSSKDRYTCSIYNLSKSYLSNDFLGHDGYCPSFAQREFYGNTEKKSGCFVTTAVCEILGKDDKCYELEVLRKFRDTRLLTNDNLKVLVYQYYEISPRFVSIIKNHSDREKFAQNVLENHIQSIILAIEAGKDLEAVEKYKNMLTFIESSL